jgi:hypothetical protein
MFNKNFKEAVRNRTHYPMNYELPLDLNFGWNEALKLLDSHPSSEELVRGQKLSLVLTAMERRPSSPNFVKDIIKELSTIFYKNLISAHFYYGFSNRSKSVADLHRDTMDVLYLQVLGEIEWSVWQSKDISFYEEPTKRNISYEEGNRIYSSRFKPGNMIWIPREQYHLVEPYTSRLGISFGVEGPIDPSTYVNAGIPYGNK